MDALSALGLHIPSDADMIFTDMSSLADKLENAGVPRDYVLEIMTQALARLVVEHETGNAS